ncbi:hypothetical protein K227x_50530 [Rubripirellula lacrimiformis]|uniref:Glycosyltransferase RgtA/B/C/D-like domain-containing protein n=1 Tax=Rubripirellula lacrimiformis TaxID=1930273 RepID=A0A517NHM1_9BACT|nr:hypothetical protein [Rubripirellula lacrimiformis]QDT06637.1 hypothetical protein K227x_50530 [Rubripirellula lacrimiformis]
MRKEETARQQTRSIMGLMILICLSIAAGRIAVVTSPEGNTAFLSANDRSRWCTISSLVEDGTYAIDRQIAISDPVHRNRRPWGTIDKVRHTGSDGQLHYYSSKPPLLPTMIAGVYKILNLCTGMTMTAQPIYVPRILLALVNLPLLAIFLIATARVMEQVCQSRAGRITGTAVTCFATMMLPFTVSLNNHLVAAASTALAMAIYLFIADRIAGAQRGDRLGVGWWWYGAIGMASAFAAANELPALSMTALWMVLCCLLNWRSVTPFIGGVAVVAIGFFGTNWMAHQSLKPAYGHRGVGSLIARIDSAGDSSSNDPDSPLATEIQSILSDKGLAPSDATFQITPSDEAGRFVVQADGHLFALVNQESAWQLSHWDDWYEYPGSYWKDGRRRGVDRGEPSKAVYLFQMTLGHYGIFSLTPIWLLLPFGFAISLRVGASEYRWMAGATLLATLVCILFYVNRPMIDRNYGGVSTCFRWVLWFAPLWLAIIAPVLDEWSESPKRRRITGALFAASVFSMSTALASPWQSPWLYRFWQFLGWIGA